MIIIPRYYLYMGDEPDPDGNTGRDRSDETLTPKTAYNLTVKQGMTQTEVADMFGITQPRVSTLKNQYDQAKKEGKEEVSPEDFSEEELAQALGDEPADHNPYDGTECPACEDDILPSEYPSSPGVHACPHCGTEIEWSEDELA